MGRDASALLLDFDGPVCKVFSTISASNVAKKLIIYASSHFNISKEFIEDSDPLQVLIKIEQNAANANIVRKCDDYLTALESQAVVGASLRDGIREIIELFDNNIAIVTNNSAKSAKDFIVKLKLKIPVIIGRPFGRPSLMKPNTYILDHALQQLKRTNDECIMIGDSVTDIEVAQKAKVFSIAFANYEGKYRRLQNSLPDFISCDLNEILRYILTLKKTN